MSTVAIIAPEPYARATQGEALLDVLSFEERAQADRFFFEEDRTSYVVAHHLMRTMLAERLGTPASQIGWRRAEGGKPELSPPAEGVCFSLSHTRGMVACAVAEQASVGVDVEQDRVLHDVESMARSVLTPGEIGRLHEVLPERRSRAFLRTWVAKEAYAKAVGTGLSLPLTSVEVGAGQATIVCPRSGRPLEGVELRFCDAGPNHLAAVAVIA